MVGLRLQAVAGGARMGRGDMGRPATIMLSCAVTGEMDRENEIAVGLAWGRDDATLGPKQKWHGLLAGISCFSTGQPSSSRVTQTVPPAVQIGTALLAPPLPMAML